MSLDVAVIGAGVAGLACAQRCKAAGLSVRLFDKGRGPGGRLSTRRFETPLGEARADHGAQFFTARGEGLRAALAPLLQAGLVAPWAGRFQPPSAEPRLVGAPGMNGLVRGLAQGLEVVFAARVAVIAGAPGAWLLRGEHGETLAEATCIVCAVPAEQAGPLLERVAPVLAQEAAAAHSAPCWAAMAVFEGALDPGFDAAQRHDGPIAWLARDSAKPGRGGPETWVAHASRAWSEAHLEESPETVAALLRQHMQALLGAEPVHVLAHRWRYAFVSDAAGSPFGWDPGLGIATCGDWRLGPRIELAFDSGAALGQALSNALLASS